MSFVGSSMIHISLLILQMFIDWLLFPWRCTRHLTLDTQGVDPGCEGITGVLFAANWCSPFTLVPVWKIWVRSSRKEKKKKWKMYFSWRAILQRMPYFFLFSFCPKRNLIYLKLAFILCQMFIFCHWFILCQMLLFCWYSLSFV